MSDNDTDNNDNNDNHCVASTGRRAGYLDDDNRTCSGDNNGAELYVLINDDDNRTRSGNDNSDNASDSGCNVPGNYIAWNDSGLQHRKELQFG